MALPRAIVIHGLDHARQALAPGRPVTLLSAPGAAGYGGCLWWRRMLDRAGTRADTPDVLDCADAPGRALEALACGCRILVLRAGPGWDSVAERAAWADATLLREAPPALDLDRPGAQRHIDAWLGIG